MDELVKGFTHLSQDEFRDDMGTVVLMLGQEPAATEFAAMDPTYETLGSEYVAYCNALDMEDSPSATILRGSTRDTLMATAAACASSCERIANGNLVMLSHTGFKFRKTPEHSHELPAAPTNPRLKNGSEAGSVLVTVGRPENVGSLEVQTAPDADDGPWTYAGSYTSSQNMESHGHPVGAYLWVRVRGIGANGPGFWSDPVRIMVG